MVCVSLLFVATLLIGSTQSRLICDLQEADGIKCECREHEAICEATKPLRFLLPETRKNELAALQKKRREANPMINSIMLQSPRNESFLQTIPTDIFEKSLNFVKINIAYASLDVLRKGAVTGSNILQKLTMSFSGISDLEQEAIDGLLSLEELDLSNNMIKVLRANALKNLPALRELTIAHSELETIESHALVHLNKLQKLNLRQNRLDQVDILYFTGLGDVRELDLSYNEIRRIDDNAFSHLTSLERLNLTGNNLVTIGATTFSSLPRLQTLDLHFNRITVLASGFLKQSRNLRELDLSRNRMVVFPPEYLKGLGALRPDFVLDLRVNPLNCSCELNYLNEMRRRRQSIRDDTSSDAPEFDYFQCQYLDQGYWEPKMFPTFMKSLGCPELTGPQFERLLAIDDENEVVNGPGTIVLVPEGERTIVAVPGVPVHRTRDESSVALRITFIVFLAVLALGVYFRFRR